QLDLGVRQGDEHGGDAVLGLRHRRGDLGAERIAIERRSLAQVAHRDRHVIETANHHRLLASMILKHVQRFSEKIMLKKTLETCAPYTVSTCTWQIGFFRQAAPTAARTARRAASATASGSRRRGRGIDSIASSTAS